MAGRKKKIKTKSLIITFILFAVVSVVIGFIVYNNYIKKYNYTNPDDATGNTAGNLINGGKFCEKDGYIYFSNVYDSNTLWRMKSNCSSPKKLGYDSASSINVYGNFIYFSKYDVNWRGSKDTGLIRVTTKGKDRKALSSYNITTINLVGNSLYLLASPDNKLNHLYRFDIKDNKMTQISDQAYNPSSIDGNIMYFSNLGKTHAVSRMSLVNYQVSPYFESNSYKAIYTKQYTYYIDLDANYSLVKVNNSTGDRTVLFEGSKDNMCITYNFTDNYVYYYVQTPEKSLLYRCDQSGNSAQKIFEGTIDGIFCTSEYTFVTMYKDKHIYRFKNSAASPAAELLEVR